MTSGGVAGRNRWLRCYVSLRHAPVRLVCFPHAGGSASFYRTWARRLAPAVELLIVQYPGRERRIRERCVEDLHHLADLIHEALDPLLERRLALFGHSFGAAVAYEVARRVEQRSRSRVAKLFVSGRDAPHRQRPTCRHLADDDRLWEELRRLGGTTEAVLDSPQLRSLVLPALRSDYRASATYQPRPGRPLACPIVALMGEQDPEVRYNGVRSWRELTLGGFELRSFPGGHFYLVPREAELLAELRRQLGVQ